MQKLNHVLMGTALLSMLALPLATNAQTVNPSIGAGFNSTFYRNRASQVIKRVSPTIKKTVTTNKAVKKVSTTPKVKNAISGSVNSISGTNLTVGATDGSTYSVDASQAKLMVNGSDVELSNVRTGDKIRVQGTINGTSVVAVSLTDMSFQGRIIFSGMVTAVSGTTITMIGGNKTVYTIDAGSTAIKIRGMSATNSVGSIAVGDRIVVVGSLNGSTVTATSIRDLMPFGRMMGKTVKK